MKIFLILFFILILTASNGIRKLPQSRVDRDREYVNKVLSRYPVAHKRRKSDCILRLSYQYGHPVKVFTDLGARESGFRRCVVSDKNAIGLYQILSNVHNEKMYQCRRGKFGKWLLRQPKKINHTDYLFWIGINVEMGAMILSNRYRECGRYSVALVGYNYGPNSAEYKECRKNPEKALEYRFVRDILANYKD